MWQTGWGGRKIERAYGELYNGAKRRKTDLNSP